MKIFASLLFSMCFLVAADKWLIVNNDLKITRLSNTAYLYVATSEIEGFGKVDSNGLILIENDKAFLFDTPINDAQTKILLDFTKKKLGVKHFVGFIPNHWHDDAIGGLAYIHSQNIPSYANDKTIEFAKKYKKEIPKYGFKDFLEFRLDNIKFEAYYLGAAHTYDNIVVYLPDEKILFAGCMLKDFNAKNLGNIADSDIKNWANTLKKVKQKFKNAKIFIPGHGDIGDNKLIDKTLQLLQEYQVQNEID